MRYAIVRVLAAAVLLVATPLAMPSTAQDIAPMVIVPDHPGGIPVNGCYTATRNLFGPYRFSFCLHRPGSYSVRGGGVRCDGRMTWHVRGRDIIADIHRTSCGGGVAWERASMDCRPAGRIFGNQRYTTHEMEAMLAEDRLKDRQYAGVVAQNSKTLSTDDVLSMMDAHTVLAPEDLVKFGLADDILD